MNTFNYQITAFNAAHGILGSAFVAVLIVVLLFELVVKGFALWHAARNRQPYWFIVLIIVHTLGILDAIYLIWFRKDRNAVPASTSSAQ